MLLLFGALAFARNSSNFDFQYRDYNAMLDKFTSLQEQHPGMIEVFDALERWPHIAKNDVPNCLNATWHYNRCKYLVVHITNLTEYRATDLMPEMYISGAVHGDEIVGPHVVAGLAEFLLTEYENGHFRIQHLLNTRSLWMTPMTNAPGFSDFVRHELSLGDQVQKDALRREQRDAWLKSLKSNSSKLGEDEYWAIERNISRMGYDPNRDFPYNDPYGDGKTCLNTITARVVVELLKTQMIQIFIDLHGGDESLSHQWGSPNHSKKDPNAALSPARRKIIKELQKYLSAEYIANFTCPETCADAVEIPDSIICNCMSTDAPDMKAFQDVTANMHAAFGETECDSDRNYTVPHSRGCWYFPEPSPSTDNHYSTNGGSDDFAYAYSWEKDINTQRQNPSYKNPIMDNCSSSRFGNYTMRHREWKQSVKAMHYLIETTKIKLEHRNYGSSDEVFRNTSKRDGHVARNVRVLIGMMDLLVPEIMFVKNGIVGLGCTSFRARLITWSGDCSRASNETILKEYQPTKCASYQRWQHSQSEHEEAHPFDALSLNYTLQTRDCYAIVASFDEEWGLKGRDAHPNVTPQSHLVRARTEEVYRVDNALGTGPRIEAKKERLFHVPLGYEENSTEAVAKTTNSTEAVAETTTPSQI